MRKDVCLGLTDSNYMRQNYRLRILAKRFIICFNVGNKVIEILFNKISHD
jgi:hypothetical protein